MKSDSDYNTKMWTFGVPIGEIKIGMSLGETYRNGYTTFSHAVIGAKKFDAQCKKHSTFVGWAIIMKVNSNYQIDKIVPLKDAIRIQKLNQL
jgi:hypothetical protein